MATRTHFGRRKAVRIAAAVAMAASMMTVAVTAQADHGNAEFAGSNFEIDEDANLINDDGTEQNPTIDWADLDEDDPDTPAVEGPEIRRTDAPTGQDDDSYKGGVKEDTECPAETTGSIPNNKSDLLTFHVYEEPGDPGFLNLAWSRVSDPSGTTLMDFEFNQSAEACDQGPNVVRTGDGDGPLADDLLIEYAIDQGGAQASISGRFWTGSEWGPSIDLTAPRPECGNAPCAAGTINTSIIEPEDSDGLTDNPAVDDLQPRTFGEAQIDLDLIFDDSSCTSFGSAMLKSRSSTSFTSQLKDFIRPVPVNLQNCGNVIIRKQTDPDEDPNTTEFKFSKSFSTDPTTPAGFTLTDDGVKDFNDDVLFGTGYTVEELLGDDLPDGWDFVDVDCSASTGVTPSISGAVVTFDIDADTDVLDCTFNNRARGTVIVEKVTTDGFGAFDFTSTTLSPSPFTLTTTAAGAGGKDSRTFSDLAPGTYDVAESVPTGWNLTSATCDDGSDPASIGLSAGETVTCTFEDARERGAIEISKSRKFAGATEGDPFDQPHPNVTFTITGGELPAEGVTAVTGADGTVCVGDLVVSTLVGDYTVTEMVPDGYVADGDEAKTVSVTAESTCGDGNEAGVGFSNSPLTDVSIDVTSQDPDATRSTIDCVDSDGDSVGGVSTPMDPAGIDIANLEIGTYTCTIVIDP